MFDVSVLDAAVATVVLALWLLVVSFACLGIVAIVCWMIHGLGPSQ